MDVGKLNKRVELHAVTLTADGMGEAITTYASYATVWAQIRPMQANETAQSDQIVTKVLHKITIRYNSSVTETDRIVYDSRTFDINSILDQFENERYMELTCTEVK